MWKKIILERNSILMGSSHVRAGWKLRERRGDKWNADYAGKAAEVISSVKVEEMAGGSMA